MPHTRASHILRPYVLEPGKLIIASHNQGKVREITALLGAYGITPISAAALHLPEPEETGTTFLANATLKALAAAQAPENTEGLPALSDDSGLCVDALAGAPGVYTADWAERQWFEGAPGSKEQGRDWYMAMGKVEGRLAGLQAETGTAPNRAAQFICTLVLAWPDGHTQSYEGRVNGKLTWPPRGKLGFGYDPVFVPEGHSQTFAEIAPEVKHAMSHRAHAFAQLVAAHFG